MQVRIDSHQHYWDIARKDYGWLTPDQGVLYRNYWPEHLAPERSAYEIAYTVAVQAAPSVEETRYLLEWSDRSDSVIGVVGWLDFESPDFETQYTELRKHPKFVGVRPMIQDLPTNWLLRDSVTANLRLLADDSFPFDLQLRPFLMDSALTLLERIPHLRAVIDHIAKPQWSDSPDVWQRQMERLADYPNVMCKLSGMVPEVAAAEWTVEQIRPYAAFAAEVFGPARVMYGSDWPVCLLSATYGQVHDLLRETLPESWTERELTGVWGGNAAAFYRLNISG